jgi:hypothetical protein
MRIKLLLLAVCSLALLGCGGSRSGSVRIADVTKTKDLNLVSGYSGIGSDVPSGITLHIHGQIVGSAYVFAGNWEPTKLSGPVEWRIYHDWFKANCVLHYIPESVQSGELTVDYTIH